MQEQKMAQQVLLLSEVAMDKKLFVNEKNTPATCIKAKLFIWIQESSEHKVFL